MKFILLCFENALDFLDLNLGSRGKVIKSSNSASSEEIGISRLITIFIATERPWRH
jgi:hypothetical protein